MKFLVGSSIGFVVFGLMFGASLFGGNTPLLALSFCSLSLVVYPMVVVALYRVFAGRTEKGVAIVSKEERNLIERYRRRVTE